VRRATAFGPALGLAAVALAACSAAAQRAHLDRDVRAGFEGACGATGPIPYELCNQRGILVPITVNGVSTIALLDSGANLTALERGFAERIGVVSDRTISVRGMLGSTTGGLARDTTVSIGSLRLDGLSPAILDLTDLAQCSGRVLPAILGEDVFERVVVEVDVAGRTVRFHDPARFSAPAGATRVPLERMGLGRGVLVSVEGRPEVAARLDLGCGAALVLGNAYWSRERLLEGRRSSTGLAAGVDGVGEYAIATIRTLRFAGLEFRDVPTAFKPASEGGTDPGAAAILGLPVIGRSHLWIDYAHDAIYVRPDPAQRGASFDRARLGLSFDQEAGFLRVAQVAGGGPGAAAGFRTGELVASIDGIPATEWTPTKRRALATRPAGTVVTFRMADGTTRTVTLADYY
jgi:hypothetical protein